jgi:hypothetical protein
MALTTNRKAYLWGFGGEYSINPANTEDALIPTTLVCFCIFVFLMITF